MSRARTDQACLEAQMQQQIAQGLNAELAVPCPDCGVESGRACRDSLDRAVRTHLARSVAANRRDTEPCPAPMAPDEARAFVAEQVSLTRASARAFAESLRGERPSFTRWRCPKCSRVTETRPLFKIDCCTGHEWTAMVPTLLDGTDKTPTASDCAPSPAASAPDAVASTRPVCACGQTIWNELTVCGDCRAENVSALLCMPPPAPLDKRIAETKSDDATECAWSTPTSDGEGWR